MKIEWSRLALGDREAIFDHILIDSPRSAVMVDELVSQAVQALATFPESSRPGRVLGTRELVIPRTPYIVACSVADDVIRVLRVLHGAQIWPVSL